MTSKHEKISKKLASEGGKFCEKMLKLVRESEQHPTVMMLSFVSAIKSMTQIAIAKIEEDGEEIPEVITEIMESCDKIGHNVALIAMAEPEEKEKPEKDSSKQWYPSPSKN